MCVVGGVYYFYFVGVFDGYDGGVVLRLITLVAVEIFKDVFGDGAIVVVLCVVVKVLEMMIVKLDEFWVWLSLSGGVMVVFVVSGEDGFAVAYAGDSAAYACFADSLGCVKV